MARVTLDTLALARSGDKGRHSNIGLIARTPAAYAFLAHALSAERVAAHFQPICRGAVVRYELPNLLAFNFVLHDSLAGGGTEALQSDAQGKAYGLALLMMELEVDEELLATLPAR